ncbi:MAG TPA: hypothetical protein DCM28_17800, partial [Phycisphaerales bacterium]|nr:hypothetical protein [Phycisphaerales bacterium]
MVVGYRTMMLLIAFVLTLPVLAQQQYTVPQDALDHSKISKLRYIPKCDVAALSALIPDAKGPPVVLWEKQSLVTLPISLPAVGSYEITIAHLAGGRYAPLIIKTPDGQKITTQRVNGDVLVQLTTFQTDLIPGHNFELAIQPTISQSPIALMYIQTHIKRFDPVNAACWKVGSLEQSAEKTIQHLGLNQADAFDIPNTFESVRAIASQPGRVMMPAGQTVCAMTYFYNDLAFTGYSFSLKTNTSADVYVNGKCVSSLTSVQEKRQIQLPWNRIKRGVNRLVVMMPSESASDSERWFEFSASDAKHTRFFSSIPHAVDPRKNNTDWPRVSIQNNDVRAILPLPDTQKGFYRSIRFEWAGQIEQLSVGDTQLLASLHQDHSPTGLDYATGTAEEFFEPIGFDEVSAGESFMKLGVGLLQKPMDHEYFFGAAYWPIRFFDWQTDVQSDKVTFTQHGESPTGHAYRYVKALQLTDSPKGLVIEHQLTNTGKKRIVTNHYNHNFIRINNTDIDKRYRVDFPYSPQTLNNVRSRMKLNKNQVTPLGNGTIFTPMTGFADVSDSHLTVTHLPSDTKLHIRSDQPMIRFWFFASDRVICPEMFTHIDLPP